MGIDGYAPLKQKCDRFCAIGREISQLIGTPKQRWLTLETGEMVLPGLGLDEDAALLANYTDRMQQGIFHISVLGVCNAGKSTLLNALLGSEVLPTSPLPTTAVVTNIVYSEHNQITVFEEGSEQGYEINKDVFSRDFTLTMTDINTIDEQGHMDNRLEYIQSVQVAGPYSFLAYGVQLVDTPGLGVCVNHSIFTPGSLQYPGVAILFILNAIYPFSQEIESFIATAFGTKRREQIFYIINRIDQLLAEEATTLKQAVRNLLRRQFTDESNVFDDDLYAQRIFFLSAKKALEASIASNDEELAKSGILALRRALEHFFISEEQSSQVIEPIFQVMKHVVEKACQRVAQENSNLPEQNENGKIFMVLSEKKRLKILERRLRELLTEADNIAHNSTIRKLDWPATKIITGPLSLSIANPSEVIAGVEDIDFDEHLCFARQVIERAELPAPMRTELRERVNEIFYRRTDQKLYMAVVGEFNSGKSTLINAFLRQTLLKTAVKVTTATATRIRYSSKLNVEVLFKNQKELLNYRKDTTRIWQLISFLHGEDKKVYGDLPEFVHLVTAVDRVADNIEYVAISHPAPFLSSCVIIDTPGMNAEKELHAQITTHLIEQEADAAVVVIPAPVPLSLTLTNFLNASLRPFLHRCLFVVTQMDKIEKDEQTLLLANIRSRLTASLGLDHDITLYHAAPKIVLDTLEERSVPSDLQHWNNKFIDLESLLWDRLQRERSLSIAERLLRLLTHLFERLDTHLRKDQSETSHPIQADLIEINHRRTILLEKQKQLMATVV